MNLENMKPLNNQQYEGCKTNALKLVKKRIGKKPERADFEKEYGPILTILDKFAIVVFLASFVVSAMHIIGFTGHEANASYQQAMTDVLGLEIGSFLYGISHNLGYLFLSEFSVILFGVMAGISNKTYEKILFWFLVLLAVGFIFLANMSSGLHPFLGFITPIFTLGTSWRLKEYFSTKISRNNEVDTKYHEALENWNKGTLEPEKHPLYKELLAAEIWSKLVSLKANVAYVDTNIDFKRDAVLRELKREHVFSNLDVDVKPNFPTPPTIQNNSNGHNQKVIQFGE